MSEKKSPAIAAAELICWFNASCPESAVVLQELANSQFQEGINSQKVKDTLASLKKEWESLPEEELEQNINSYFVGYYNGIYASLIRGTIGG